MAIDGRTVLAVVPARGGSTSIPRKNLAVVGGNTLVGRAAKVAGEVGMIDRAIVSTDDQDIADEAVRNGVELLSLRPERLAGDDIKSVEVWRHEWLAAEDHYGMRFDLSVLLEPTSPLRRAEHVEQALRTLVDGGHRAAATVSPTPAHFTPHKTLTIDDRGVLDFYLSDGTNYMLRQGIPSYFHRNGLCYAVERSVVVDDLYILEDDCAAVIVDEPIVNIDDPFELELAEWMLSRDEAE